VAESGKAVVLAVDDTPENLDVVKGILVPEYTVKVAPNGKVALKIAEKQPPDVILLDIMMPEIDGYEVCRRLKSNPVTADIPVIFLTAKDQTADETEGFEIGAADYILKPVNPPILQARVKTHVTLKRNREVLAQAKKRMEQELNVGRDIQLSMLPDPLPDRPELTLAARMDAAREVGGDFFDYFYLDDDNLAFCVADVSGKGVPSALFMAVGKTLLKSRAADDQSPASIMTHVNDELSKDNPTCMFITIFLGKLNLRSGELTYTNAGHNPPLLRRVGAPVEVLSDLHGPIVGAVEGLAYKQSTAQVAKGDALLVFSDGVTEAMNPMDELYSDQRLLDFVQDSGKQPPSELVASVRASVDSFADGAEQADDITLLALAFEGDPEQVEAHSFTLSISNQLSEIDRVNDAFNAFAGEVGLPEEIATKLNVVFDDLLNNVVSYAFPEGGEHEIDVEADFRPDRLTVRVTDGGMPFNPFIGDDPDITLSIEERDIGGLGILIIKSFMDKYTYHRRSNRNEVTLVKYLDA
jgi:sigma-B regulation protein RsbU (phosphoserine phosphatase)